MWQQRQVRRPDAGIHAQLEGNHGLIGKSFMVAGVVLHLAGPFIFENPNHSFLFSAVGAIGILLGAAINQGLQDQDLAHIAGPRR